MVIRPDGRGAGEAIVVLPNHMEMQMALSRDKQHMGRRWELRHEKWPTLVDRTILDARNNITRLSYTLFTRLGLHVFRRFAFSWLCILYRRGSERSLVLSDKISGWSVGNCFVSRRKKRNNESFTFYLLPPKGLMAHQNATRIRSSGLRLLGEGRV